MSKLWYCLLSSHDFDCVQKVKI